MKTALRVTAFVVTTLALCCTSISAMTASAHAALPHTQQLSGPTTKVYTTTRQVALPSSFCQQLATLNKTAAAQYKMAGGCYATFTGTVDVIIPAGSVGPSPYFIGGGGCTPASPPYRINMYGLWTFPTQAFRVNNDTGFVGDGCNPPGINWGPHCYAQWSSFPFTVSTSYCDSGLNPDNSRTSYAGFAISEYGIAQFSEEVEDTIRVSMTSWYFYCQPYGC